MGLHTAVKLWILLGILWPIGALGSFSNYSSVLLGDKASGMGGAFVAMTGDPSSMSFYNPATLAQSAQSTFSATANLYNKYDTSFSDSGDLSDSTLKLNRGGFQAFPAAAGSAISFGTFAIGISIITPDFNIYAGDITAENSPNATTFLSLKDQSLWVGGSLAINFTEKFSWGLTAYYTSRSLSRATTEQVDLGSDTLFSYQNKSLSTNSIIYTMGAYYKLTDKIRLGTSYRFPSILLSGEGTFYNSVLDTRSSNMATETQLEQVATEFHVPPKLSIGAAYVLKKYLSISVQADLYGGVSYMDLVNETAGTRIQHEPTANYSIGLEYHISNWLALRSGVFTNFSSHPEIVDSGIMQSDRVDMLGFSANLGFHAENTSLTLGGYFTGGQGKSTQSVGQSVVILPKNEFIYAFLVSSSYYF